MTARDGLLRDAALCLVVTFLVIGSYLYGGAGTEWSEQPIQSGLSALSTPDSIEQSSGPVYVVLTPPGWVSPTPEPTMTPMPTRAPNTPVPPCIEGQAKPGGLCVQPTPTVTVIVQTPVSTHPGEAATPGTFYLWRRD